MKKIFLIPALVALLGVNVYAAGGRKLNESKVRVSSSIVNQFESDFKGAENVIWTVTKNVQEADFTMDGQKMSAFYNFSGQFLGLTHDLDASAIPAKAMKQIAEQYKGYSVGKVILLQSSSNTDAEADAYFVDLKNADQEVLVSITPQANVEYFQTVK